MERSVPPGGLIRHFYRVNPPMGSRVVTAQLEQIVRNHVNHILDGEAALCFDFQGLGHLREAQGKKETPKGADEGCSISYVNGILCFIPLLNPFGQAFSAGGRIPF